MSNRGDIEGIAKVAEAEAVIAYAEPELGRFNVLQALHIALACGSKAGEGMKNAQGDWLLDRTKLHLCLFPPCNLPEIHAYGSG
jgi:hypothetical protein